MEYNQIVPLTPLTVLTSGNPGLLILNKYSVTYGVYLVCSTLYNLQWCHNAGWASIVTKVNFPGAPIRVTFSEALAKNRL